MPKIPWNIEAENGIITLYFESQDHLILVYRFHEPKEAKLMAESLQQAAAEAAEEISLS